MKVVRGTASAPGGRAGEGRQGWRAAPRDIFVYHTHHSTSEEDINLRKSLKDTLVQIAKTRDKESYAQREDKVKYNKEKQERNSSCG